MRLLTVDERGHRCGTWSRKGWRCERTAVWIDEWERADGYSGHRYYCDTCKRRRMLKRIHCIWPGCTKEPTAIVDEAPVCDEHRELVS